MNGRMQEGKIKKISTFLKIYLILSYNNDLLII